MTKTALLLLHPGTSIESSGSSLLTLFKKSLEPVLKSRPDLWPSPWDSFSKVLEAACLMQSRAFHMQADNWVTGAVNSWFNIKVSFELE